ncbi:MAG: Low molecular weight protein-tyrosine-phosphatase YfkJ [Luteibacter sp.]|uniref:low molecular weight protein-tyrosine-phosphatase n=1 Tax=Luteibacter sp. TaxID=1886636 RepID=UPI0013861B87|nr:low molecular weight protein-tyrosine-phosphatase [Luteibacter sp.]KAF1005726.1 MAG: Low molecular weight protein-tyrosine-phosphatase YfkJ [Luteibacter sp.]
MNATDAPHASVLFVCTGNICRSPTAHALLVHKAAAAGLIVDVDSAAVTDSEVGNPPDARSLAELRRRGIPMPAHRARRVTAEDFARFDLVVGMTTAHVATLRRMAPEAVQKIGLMMVHSADHGAIDVPDPWYGKQADFIEVFDMLDVAVDGLLASLRRRDTAIS